MLDPLTEEIRLRDCVIAAIKHAVSTNTTIKLPRMGDQTASEFAGSIGGFRYEFEGEDDLLHLAVTRADGSSLTAEEGQAVATFLMPNMPPGLVWIRPGEFSQHFYCGHDDLVQHVNGNR